MTLADALETLNPHIRDATVVMANGYISRAGHGIEDRPRNFYMIGSMGLASSIGLGLALARPSEQVVVLDGDGNVLMNLAALATVASLRPRNFHHVVLDNEAYASTGNQPTLSSIVALDAIAKAAGYARVERCELIGELRTIAEEVTRVPGPSFHLVKIEREEGTAFGRVAIEPEDMTRRFRDRAA